MNFNILSLFKNINFSNIFANTNKTLNIIKKSIPVYRQVKPYVTHEKSFFKSKNDMNNVDTTKESKLLKGEENSPRFNDTLTFFK
jgi:hypothetical protein